jgi:hypothetical protein
MAGIVLLFVALRSSSSRIAFGIILAAIAAQRVVEDGNIYPAVPRHMFYPSAFP